MVKFCTKTAIYATAITTNCRVFSEPYESTFLGSFEKLRKATISFNVCPSVRMEELGSH